MKKCILVLQLLIFASRFTFASDTAEIARLDSTLNSLVPIISQLEKKCDAFEKNSTEPTILKEFERIAEDAYNRKHKRSEETITFIMFLITILLATFAIVSTIVGVYYYKISKEKYNEEINKFMKAVDEKYNLEVRRIQTEFSDKLRETRAEFYYQNGMGLLRRANYELAIGYFKALYENKTYRFEDVVYHIAECYLFLVNLDPDKIINGKQIATLTPKNKKNILLACKYLNEAKKNTKDNNKLTAIIRLIKGLGCEKFGAV